SSAPTTPISICTATPPTARAARGRATIRSASSTRVPTPSGPTAATPARPATRRATSCRCMPRAPANTPGRWIRRRRARRRSNPPPTLVDGPDREGVNQGDLFQVVEPPGRAAVAGLHVYLQQNRLARGRGRPQLRHPFLRLPVGHAR